MANLRIQRAGGLERPARQSLKIAVAASALGLALLPFPALDRAAAQTASARQWSGQSVNDFYAARGNRPLWTQAGNEQAGALLLQQLETARLDGLSSKRYKTRDIARALRSAAGGNPASARRAEMLLSQAFVTYARDLRQAPNVGIIYVDPQLRPQPPSAYALLQSAAAAPSLARYVAAQGWMHPYYGEIRRVLQYGNYSGVQRQQLGLNLERARSLPATNGRYVLVNAAAQRLFMYENGQVVGTMRVVVGKAAQPTPMMTALIRYTSLNPYWNVPPDLAAERIAPNVLKEGMGYLRKKGYQVLSDWSDKPRVLNAAAVDWKSVAAGQKEVRVRQLPGPSNSMGAMKFMFPNAQGIYLHDTPNDELFSEASRLFSGGCVRLEDAPRLAEWMYGTRLRPKGARPEQEVPLKAPVPVYLTYLTTVPSGGAQVAFYEDIYGRDRARLAQLAGSGRQVASR